MGDSDLAAISDLSNFIDRLQTKLWHDVLRCRGVVQIVLGYTCALCSLCSWNRWKLLISQPHSLDAIDPGDRPKHSISYYVTRAELFLLEKKTCNSCNLVLNIIPQYTDRSLFQHSTFIIPHLRHIIIKSRNELLLA